VVPEHKLLAAIAHLRAVGGTDITVFSPNYVFQETSKSSEALMAMLAG